MFGGQVSLSKDCCVVGMVRGDRLETASLQCSGGAAGHHGGESLRVQGHLVSGGDVGGVRSGTV